MTPSNRLKSPRVSPWFVKSEISVLAVFKIMTPPRAREERAGESGTGPWTAYRPGAKSPQAPAETPTKTQDPEMKKANRERLAFRNWWTEAESNRSPQALRNQIGRLRAMSFVPSAQYAAPGTLRAVLRTRDLGFGALEGVSWAVTGAETRAHQWTAYTVPRRQYG